MLRTSGILYFEFGKKLYELYLNEGFIIIHFIEPLIFLHWIPRLGIILTFNSFKKSIESFDEFLDSKALKMITLGLLIANILMKYLDKKVV